MSTDPITLRATGPDEWSWPESGRLAVWHLFATAPLRWVAAVDRDTPPAAVLSERGGGMRLFATPAEAAAALGARLP